LKRRQQLLSENRCGISRFQSPPVSYEQLRTQARRRLAEKTARSEHGRENTKLCSTALENLLVAKSREGIQIPRNITRQNAQYT
jgi:hypothetical protein